MLGLTRLNDFLMYLSTVLDRIRALSQENQTKTTVD